MTVQELIELLSKVKNKNLIVKFDDNSNWSNYLNINVILEDENLIILSEK